jgi:hypothetical protein
MVERHFGLRSMPPFFCVSRQNSVKLFPLFVGCPSSQPRARRFFSASSQNEEPDERDGEGEQGAERPEPYHPPNMTGERHKKKGRSGAFSTASPQ